MKPFTALYMTGLMVVAAGCTHNDGGDERLYGQWQLVLTEAQGDAEAPGVAEDNSVYWRFQSSTLEMSLVYANHGSDNRFGNYRVTDDTLFLDFPDEGVFGEPLLGLPRQCELQLVECNSKSLTVIYNPTPDGQVIYRFRKW